MGTEYKINFTPDEFDAFETHIHGKTLDSVLRGAPGFVDTKDGVYRYNESGDPGNDWFATVSIHDDGILLAYYRDGGLLTHLMWEVLDVCGRLSVEDG